MAAGGGGRAARALRLLLLLVLALAAVEYLFGFSLDDSPLRTYLYTPHYNATQPSIRSIGRSAWSKKLPTTAGLTQSTKARNNAKHSANNVRPYVTSIQSKRTPVTLDINGNSFVPLNCTTMPITKPMDSIKHQVTTEGVDFRKNETELALCDVPSDLGPVPVNKRAMQLDIVDMKYPEVHWGGRYSPPNCTARHKVAIIVPYRDRQQHLAIFLNHMHPFLMKQQLEYGMFIVEQEGKQPFNRAKLLNVGFVESQKQKAGGWQCFVFHDVDRLPLDQRNLYSCPRQPRHMSASVEQLNFSLSYENLFGGVSAMTVEQFEKVNGFSNRYWGWGGEDDDMAYRFKLMNYHITRYKMSIARYTMLDHKIAPPNPKRHQLLSQTSKKFKKDGLSNLEYMIFKVTHHHLYIHILVNIDERS